MKNFLTERTNLFEPNDYIQLLVQLEGNPSTDDAVSAVKSAFAANESTMSKIVLEKDGTAFYERMETSGCSVTVAQGDWREIIRENEKRPFGLEHGELMRVFVIHSGESISLLIMAHHLAGDGKSITYFAEDVMNALSGKTLNYKPLNLITEDSFAKDAKLPFAVKSYVNRLNKKWKNTGKNFTWEDYYNLHNKYWREHDSQFICETFSADELNKIKLCAKVAGVSVNSYIVTAFLEANRDNKTLGLPISIRADSDKSMSNQTSGISVDYVYSDKISFDKNAKKVHKQIYKKLNRPIMKYFVLKFLLLLEPTLIDSVLLYTHGLYQNKVSEKMAEVMGYIDKTRDIGITNLTKIDIPTVYGHYKIKNMIFIPPAVSYARHIIGISTTGEIMTATYHYMGDKNEPKEKKFFERGIMTLKNVTLEN